MLHLHIIDAAASAATPLMPPPCFRRQIRAMLPPLFRDAVTPPFDTLFTMPEAGNT